MNELGPLLSAAANRIEGGEKIFRGTSPSAYAYLLRRAADGHADLDERLPQWLQGQLFALLDGAGSAVNMSPGPRENHDDGRDT